jgi:ubiquinone/menaquinone biosynthesis C-methylase UbiE
METYEAHDEFASVTELPGEDVSQEQVERLCAKYYWAASYCKGKDVLELGCGTGPGLGYLAKTAKSVSAGDISDEILRRAKAHYGDRIELKKVDAQDMPYPAKSKDVILLFEAIYYLPDVEKFLSECRRVLRDEGTLLVVTCNKDLYGFNPSPYSHKYYGVKELKELLDEHGFATKFFGNVAMGEVSLRQRVLQPVKKFAVQFNLIPKTMTGKKLLKRLVFGKMIKMPAEITAGMAEFDKPIAIPTKTPDTTHKVIFCAAKMRRET